MASNESNHLLTIKTLLQMALRLFLQENAGNKICSCTCMRMPHVCPWSRSPELVLESGWTGDGALCDHGNTVHHWRLFLRLTSPVDTEPLPWHAVHDVHQQYVILTHLQDKDLHVHMCVCVWECACVCVCMCVCSHPYFNLIFNFINCNSLTACIICYTVNRLLIKQKAVSRVQASPALMERV